MEEQISFTVGGQKLYGMLHLPEGPGPHPALTMIHGFTGQRVEPHRLFVKTARRLQQDGVAVLRFDCRGSGESEGDFRDMTISAEIEDAEASLQFLENRPEIDPGRLGALGLSMGGFAAACLAVRDPRVRALVLWAAGAKAARMFPRYVHLTGPHREKWLERGEWDFGGMVLGSGFLRDLETLEEPLSKLPDFRGKALVLHGDADASVPVSEAEEYRKALGAKATVQILAGADHTFNRGDWEGEVIDTTAFWLNANL